MKRRSFASGPSRTSLSLIAFGSLALGLSTAQAQAPAPVPGAPLVPPASSEPASGVVVTEPPAVEVAPAPVLPPSVTLDAPAPAPAPAPVTPPAPVEEPRARLDYSDGSFYLRSANDNIVFVPGARAHIDSYVFGGPGVGDYHKSNGTGLRPNLFFRRFVLEFGGVIRKKWFYWLGGNFAPTTVDGNQAPLSSANVYDGFVGYMPMPNLKFYFGAYNAPFTMENVTSSRWLDLMERSLTVRTLATPYNKAEGLMVWGETKNKMLEGQLGGFGGDGMNRPNVDDRFDVMGRVVLRPLVGREDALKRMHIGGGLRYGRRDSDFVRYDAPNLSTPGGYNFWSATYKQGTDEFHILPSRQQMAFAGEAYIPFERFDLRGEFVYLNEDRREVLASDRTKTLRGGELKGFGTYAQLSIWLAGTPRINGNPAGYYGVTKVPDSLGAQAAYALQLVLRGEALRLTYDPSSRFGDAGTGNYGKTDDIKVNAYQIGLNYWATKHVRLTAEYSAYQFPGNPANTKTGTPENQAIAPGANAGTKPNAHALHEVSFRVGLAL